MRTSVKTVLVAGIAVLLLAGASPAAAGTAAPDLTPVADFVEAAKDATRAVSDWLTRFFTAFDAAGGDG